MERVLCWISAVLLACFTGGKLFALKQIQSQVTPHAIVFLPSSDGMEMLLCYEDEGVYVNTYGRIIKDVVLQWGEMPTSVGTSHIHKLKKDTVICIKEMVNIMLCPQLTSAQIRSWDGEKRPLRSDQWRPATLMVCSCTKELRGSSSSVREMTR